MYEKEILPDLINVGVDDDRHILFENQFDLPEGMAYNSYLFLDEKVCLLDCVDRAVKEAWQENVEKALSGRSIDYCIIQHMEPDHSGTADWLLERFPKMQLFMSAQAAKMLGQFLEKDYSDRITLIKEGDTLALGKRTLQFIAAPMVHWPEVMLTFDKEDSILFSADAFGKFGIKGADPFDWACEARRYYFNIVGKYGRQVQAVLKKAGGLSFDRICPLHGPVLPENEPLSYYLEKYQIWSSYEPEDQGVAICFASIHDTGTRQAAYKMAELLNDRGVKTAVSDLAKGDIHEAVEDAFRYDRLLLCASSYDGDLFIPMKHFLDILTVKGFQNRRVGLVENGTWAPTAAKVMRQALEKMPLLTVVEPVVTIRSALKEGDLPALLALTGALSGEGKD